MLYAIFKNGSLSLCYYDAEPGKVARENFVQSPFSHEDFLLAWSGNVLSGNDLAAYPKFVHNFVEDGFWMIRGSELVDTGHHCVIKNFGLPISILKFDASFQNCIVSKERSRIVSITLSPHYTSYLQLAIELGKVSFEMEADQSIDYAQIHDLRSAQAWIRKYFEISYDPTTLIVSVVNRNWKVFLAPGNKAGMNPLTLLIERFGFEVFRGWLGNDSVEIAIGTAANIQKIALRHFSQYFKKIKIGDRNFFVRLISDTRNAQVVQFHGSMEGDPATLRSLGHLSNLTGEVSASESYSSYRVPEVIKYFQAVDGMILAHNLDKDEGKTSPPTRFVSSELSNSLQIGNPQKEITNRDKELLAEGWKLSFHTFCESHSGFAVGSSRGKELESRFMLTQRTSLGSEHLRTWTSCCVPGSSIFVVKLMILRNEHGVVKNSKIEIRKYVGNPHNNQWVEVFGDSLDGYILFIPQDYKSGQQDFVFLGRKLEEAIEKSVETI